MEIPFNMTSPRLKLQDGEEVIHQLDGMRKKGILGNRYGTLYLTNQRLAFVKAIMKSGVISAAVNAKGAKPMISYEVGELAGKLATDSVKMGPVLVVNLGKKPERFVLDQEGIDQIIAAVNG